MQRSRRLKGACGELILPVVPLKFLVNHERTLGPTFEVAETCCYPCSRVWRTASLNASASPPFWRTPQLHFVVVSSLGRMVLPM